MKKLYLFLLFCNVSESLISAQEVKKDYSFTQFSTDFEKFYTDPGWIMKAFVLLPLDDFDKAWELFVTTVRVDAWKFFVNNKKKYSEKKYRDLFIVHCAKYDIFLKNLLVDVKNKRLILATGAEKAQYLKQSGVITLFLYWQAKKDTKYQHFYAFYFDLLADQLYETITIGYCNHDTSDYFAFYKKAKLCFTRMVRVFQLLRGGEYDGPYAYHVKRYKEVLDILQKERKLQEGGFDAVAY